MKRELLLLFPGLLAILSLQAGSAEEPEEPQGVTEETEIMMLETFGKREPDHLVPLDRGSQDWRVPYENRLKKLLKLESPFYCRMMVLPSFEAENVISLSGELAPGGKPEDEKKLTLTYSIGDKSIWESMPTKEVQIGTTVVDFPKEQGLRICKLWDKMMERVRQPEKPNTTFDGVTYEFSTTQGRGQIWNPMSRKSPRLFKELGFSLRDYCKAPEGDRAEKLKEVDVRIGKLEKYLDEHPVKKE